MQEVKFDSHELGDNHYDVVSTAIGAGDCGSIFPVA